MRRPLTHAGIGLALILLAAGCARPGVEPGAQPDQLTSAPIDAALVTAQFGWVLTADQILLTVDSGKTFRPADLDLPAGSSRAAFFSDARRGWVASTDGTSITVARTSDGGGSWKVSNIAAAEPVGALSVGFGTATNGALLAAVQTSAAFSRAELYATSDGGASWKPSAAPVAGQIEVEPDGRVWLAGGALGNELYASRDQGRSWSSPQLRLAGSAQVGAVSPPQGGILPVTVTAAGRSRVALLTSADKGTSWRESASVPLKNEAGGAAPVAARDSGVVVADPAGNSLNAATTGAAGGSLTTSGARAAGLPAGVSHLTFAGPDTGWALASAGSCANGKQDCSISYSVVSTDDGGSLWRQVLRWQEKIG